MLIVGFTFDMIVFGLVMHYGGSKAWQSTIQPTLAYHLLLRW